MTSPADATPKAGKALTAEARMSRWEYIRVDLMLSFRSRGTYLTLAALLALTALGMATGLYWLLLPWLALFLLLVLNPYLAIRSALSRKNANFFLPCRYTFDDRGVTAQTSLGQGTIGWGDFWRWEKAAGHYVLHVRGRGRNFLAIPQSAFGPVEIAAFEEMLKKRIG